MEGFKLEWYVKLASQTTYAWLPLLAAVYLIFFGLKKIFNRMPDPLMFVMLAFFIGIFTIPSIPRYLFENETLSQYRDAGEFKLVDKANWGALIEPITLIKTPIGFFHFVSPISQPILGYDKDRARNEFRSHIYRYDEEPVYQIIDADCSDNTISISEPVDGDFRYIIWDEEMVDHQKRTYCETDYEAQVEIFYCKFNIVSKISNVSEQEVAQANTECTQ